MNIHDEINDLKLQIEHLEGAISSLNSPSTAPVSNSLAETLQARFAQLDSHEERAKSLRVAQTLMTEVCQKLADKEALLKRTRQSLQAWRSGMSECGPQVNRLSRQISEELEKLYQQADLATNDWKIAHGQDSQPIVETAKITLPRVAEDPTTRTYVISAFSLCDDEIEVRQG